MFGMIFLNFFVFKILTDLFILYCTVGAEIMARAESMARRRFAADAAAPVHFLKDFFS